jgi:hypothetical protein
LQQIRNEHCRRQLFAAQHRRVSIAGADESTTLPDPPGAAIAA